MRWKYWSGTLERCKSQRCLLSECDGGHAILWILTHEWLLRVDLERAFRVVLGPFKEKHKKYYFDVFEELKERLKRDILRF